MIDFLLFIIYNKNVKIYFEGGDEGMNGIGTVSVPIVCEPMSGVYAGNKSYDESEKSFASCLQGEIGKHCINDETVVSQVVGDEKSEIIIIHPKIADVPIHAQGIGQEVLSEAELIQGDSVTGTEEVAIAATKGGMQVITSNDGDVIKLKQKADTAVSSNEEQVLVLDALLNPLNTLDWVDVTLQYPESFETSLDTLDIPHAEATTELSAQGAAAKGFAVSGGNETVVLTENSAETAGKSETAVNTFGLGEKEMAALNPSDVKVVKEDAPATTQNSGNPQDSDELKAMLNSLGKPEIKESGELKELLGGKSEKSEANTEVKKEDVLLTEQAELAKPEQLSAKPLPIEQRVTVQVSQAVLEKLTAFGGKESSTAFEITLNPQMLGKITIKLAANATGVAVQILADNPQTRELLAMRAQHVIAAIELSGVVVEKYEVLTSAVQKSYSDLTEDERQNQQQGSKDDDDNSEEEEDVEVSFAEVIQALV